MRTARLIQIVCLVVLIGVAVPIAQQSAAPGPVTQQDLLK